MKYHLLHRVCVCTSGPVQCYWAWRTAVFPGLVHAGTVADSSSKDWSPAEQIHCYLGATHTHTDMQALTHLPGSGSGSSSRTVMDWKEAPVEMGRCSDTAEPDLRPVWISCGSAACSWTVGNCRHITHTICYLRGGRKSLFYLAEYQHCKSMIMKIASFCSIF